MMRRLSLLALLTLLATLVLPLRAGAESLRGKLELLLSQHERLPTRQQLLAVSPEVGRLLIEIVEKPSRRVLARSRALGLLRLFPSADSERVLRRTIQVNAQARGGLEWIDLQQSLAAYAMVAGARALPVLRPFLLHRSPDVRHAAVGALASLPGRKALPLLEARLRQEPSAMVRHRLARELARLRAR